MALTPEDVVNKRFQPTKFREGYDQDEVDDFLDEVVVELRRLNQENEELRQRLTASEARVAELQRTVGQPAPAQGFDQGFAAAQPPVVASAPVAPPQAAVETAVVPAVGYTPPSDPNAVDANAMDPSNTNNLLQLARRLHEEHVREGVEKRDALIAEGHATAARVLAEAEAAQRAQMSALDQERQSLESRVEELRTFEREYRQKLKGYIEEQLRELDATSPVLAGAPANVAAASAPVQNFGTAPGQNFGAAPAQNFGSAPAPTFGSAPTPPPANYQGFAGN
ncbi:MAG: DivIVA protein [Glaciihabitans sp.]|nr:DivIVA protein [Glaciihabitans sp.]MCU1535028.1 DivIVA protein [Glaciihabitans sp.]MDQ1556636.1 hypothetical protein [Actinomycetota bacterium]